MKKLSLVLVLLFCYFIGSTYVKADEGEYIYVELISSDNGICKYEFSFDYSSYILSVDLSNTDEIPVSSDEKNFIISGKESFLVNFNNSLTTCPEIVGYDNSNKTKVENLKILSYYEKNEGIKPGKKNDPTKATTSYHNEGYLCYISSDTSKYYFIDPYFYIGYLDISGDYEPKFNLKNDSDCQLSAIFSSDVYNGKCYTSEKNINGISTIWLKKDVNIKKTLYKNYKLVSSVSDRIECLSLGDSGIRAYYSCGSGAIKNIPPKLVKITRIIVLLIQIGVPIIIIILGMIDMAKGVVAQKEDEMAKGRRIFVKRLVKGLLIFLVIFIVKTSVKFINRSIDNSKISSCIDCFISGRCEY